MHKHIGGYLTLKIIRLITIFETVFVKRRKSSRCTKYIWLNTTKQERTTQNQKIQESNSNEKEIN